MSKNTKATVLILLAAAMAGGCIQSSFDPTLMYQYQRYVATKGPQQRKADSLIQQVPGTTGTPLETEVDPETGKTLVLLTIDEAVQRALYNSTAVKVISYDPAVAREDVIIAESEFDAIVTAEGALTKTDSKPRTTGTFDSSNTRSFETAVTQRFITGGQAELSYSLERFTTQPNALLFDPAYTQRLAVQLTQPLLRNAGPEVNLAQVRVARINEKISMDAFRATVLDLVSQVQSAYWTLYATREELRIRRELVDRSEATLAQVRARKNLDASNVQISDAEAVVATNKLSVIRAERRIGDAQDRLIRLIADASITLLDDFEIVTLTAPSTTALIIDNADQVAAALKYSPELAQARKAIEIQDIGVRVARNQVLPQLNLINAAGVNGVDDRFEGSWDQMWGGDYLDYTVALSFEWPIGNRARRANLRKARYNKAKSVATLQDTADQVAVAVNDAVRQVGSNYDLILAGRTSLKANQDNLEALEVFKTFREALTPDFLNRLLNQQTNVAQAQLELLTAEVNYNAAQATLARTTGTLLDDVGVLVTDTDEDVPPLLLSRMLLTGAGPEEADEAETPADQDAAPGE